MRWPFGLFGRSGSEGESAEAPAAPAVPRPSGSEWTALPPIQRSVGDTPLTASSRSFAAGLPGTVGLPLALQPLGHERSLDAPSGLVTGLATPSTYAGLERLVYVQRRAAAAPAGPDLVWPEWSEAHAAGEPASPEVTAAGPPPSPLPAPVAPRAVPSVGSSPEPAPLTVSTMPDTALPVAPLVGSRHAASALPIAAVQTVSADAPAPSQPAVAMPVRRLNVGQTRRMGLGPPLTAADGEAVVQRSAESAADEEVEAPAAAAPTLPQPPTAGEDDEAGPPVQRLADAGRPSPLAPLPRPAVSPLPPPEPQTLPALPAELSRPIFRVQRRPAGSPPSPAAARSDAPQVGRGSEPPPALPVVPGSAPAPSGADPGLPVQRAAVPPPAGVDVPGPSLPPAPAGPGDPAPSLPVVPVQRLEAEPPPASSPDQDSLPVVPARPVDAEPGPPPAAPLRPSSDPVPLPVVPVQRIEIGPGAAPDPASLSAVPVQRAEAEPMADAAPGQGVEEEDEEQAPDAAPLHVVPAQRLESGAPPASQAGADLPVVPVQRSVAVPDGPAGHAPQAPLAMPLPAAAPAPPPVAGRREAGTPLPPAFAPGTSTLPLVGDRPLPVSIPGAPAASPAAAPGGTAPAPGLAPLTFLPAAAEPFVQRVADVADGAPAASRATPATTEAATAALAPVARTARTVAQPMIAVQPSGMPAELPYLPVAGPRPPAEEFVQRAPNGQQYIAIDVPIVQRAEEAPSAASAASGGDTGGAAGGPQHSDKELDELARQLYERMRSRLRMELLVDRERSGLITDLR